MNILVIGAGQIGSRHVQGLAAIADVKSVTIVDPSLESRERTAERWRDVPGHEDKELILKETIPDHGNYAAAIIATNATARLEILQKSIALGIRVILAEKLLFQSCQQWEAALDLVQEHKAKVYPNYVYRYAHPWTALQQALSNTTFTMTVTAGDIGLTTNLPHWMDLFEYLAQSKVAKISADRIDAVYNSKRGQGLLECAGALSAVSVSGATFTIDFANGDNAPVCTIRTENNWVALNEGNGKISGPLADPSWELQTPMVSHITSLAIPDILKDQTCLPTLEATAQMNQLLLQALAPAMGYSTDKNCILPVT